VHIYLLQHLRSSLGHHPRADDGPMVEARGVEPLSEDNATWVSTGVVTVLVSPSGLPVTGFPSGQPVCLLPPAPGGD